MKAVARHTITLGHEGRIINMANRLERRGKMMVADFCAMKAAVISWTQSASVNPISHVISVNVMSPGTAMLLASDERCNVPAQSNKVDR